MYVLSKKISKFNFKVELLWGSFLHFTQKLDASYSMFLPCRFMSLAATNRYIVLHIINTMTTFIHLLRIACWKDIPSHNVAKYTHVSLITIYGNFIGKYIFLHTLKRKGCKMLMTNISPYSEMCHVYRRHATWINVSFVSWFLFACWHDLCVFYRINTTSCHRVRENSAPPPLFCIK